MKPLRRALTGAAPLLFVAACTAAGAYVGAFGVPGELHEASVLVRTSVPPPPPPQQQRPAATANWPMVSSFLASQSHVMTSQPLIAGAMAGPAWSAPFGDRAAGERALVEFMGRLTVTREGAQAARKNGVGGRLNGSRNRFRR